MSQDIQALRAQLFDTMAKVKANEIDLDRARMVNEIGKTLCETAKVEVDFLRATDGTESDFLRPALNAEQVPAGITGRTIHRIG